MRLNGKTLLYVYLELILFLQLIMNLLGIVGIAQSYTFKSEEVCSANILAWVYIIEMLSHLAFMFYIWAYKDELVSYQKLRKATYAYSFIVAILSLRWWIRLPETPFIANHDQDRDKEEFNHKYDSCFHYFARSENKFRVGFYFLFIGAIIWTVIFTFFLTVSFIRGLKEKLWGKEAENIEMKELNKEGKVKEKIKRRKRGMILAFK